MKANLAIREVEILKRWQDELVSNTKDLFKDRPYLFDGMTVLHANGNIHIRHA